jgi:hypothetical protein
MYTDMDTDYAESRTNESFADKLIFLSEQDRRERIINFILNNPGCTAADIIDGQTVSGRKKVFGILKDLKQEGVVSQERSKPNSRNIRLFVNQGSYFVTLPREIDDFEKLFTSFLSKLIDHNVATLAALKTEILSGFSPNEVNHHIDDPDTHTSFEELILVMSTFVKALQLFNGFVNLYTMRSIIHWPQKINDKESLKKLLLVVFDKISKLQIQVIEMITPKFRLFSDSIRIPIESVRSPYPINLNEVAEYYGHFGLKDEVDSVLRYIKKLQQNESNNIAENQNPFHKWGLINPTEISIEDVREFYDPEYYYNVTNDTQDSEDDFQ